MVTTEEPAPRAVDPQPRDTQLPAAGFAIPVWLDIYATNNKLSWAATKALYRARSTFAMLVGPTVRGEVWDEERWGKFHKSLTEFFKNFQSGDLSVEPQADVYLDAKIEPDGEPNDGGL